MLVVRSWATRAWIRKSLIISTCPSTALPKRTLLTGDNHLSASLLLLTLTRLMAPMLREEPGGVWDRLEELRGATNRSWCCWARGMQSEARREMQLPWPLAHSLLVSLLTPSPDRPCGLQGIQSQLTSRVLSCNMGRVLIRLDDYGEPWWRDHKISASLSDWWLSLRLF